jgi:hypothetical protein
LYNRYKKEYMLIMTVTPGPLMITKPATKTKGEKKASVVDLIRKLFPPLDEPEVYRLEKSLSTA